MLAELRGMEEREVPAPLQDRLHAALSNEILKGDGRVKRKLNPWALTAIATVVVVCLFGGGVLLGGINNASPTSLMYSNGLSKAQDSAGLEAPSANRSLIGSASEAAPEATAAPAAPALAGKSANGDNGPLQSGDGRKLIYTAYIMLETREFDKCTAQVNELLAKYGGYVESSQVNGVPEASESTQGRTAVIALRMPIDKYGTAMGELQAMGNLLSKNENTDDVSLQYVDTDSRNKTLIAQRDRYMALLEKADSTESIIALQTEITNLTIQIEQNTAQLRFWDDKVSYSTISVELHELVIPKSIEPSNPDLGARASGAFYTTLNNMKKGLEDFAVGFIGFLPWLAILLVLAGAALAIIIPATRRARKAAAKRVADAKKKEE